MTVMLIQVVLDLLQIPFDQKEDVRMNELMRLAHQFLQNFCLSNQNNQVWSSQNVPGYHFPIFDISRFCFTSTLSCS